MTEAAQSAVNKMNPEVKARWVAALRSGNYTQAEGQLRRPTGGMCCLGVLCDIKDSAAWRLDGSYLEEGFDGVPPREVLTWAGMKHGHVEVVIGERISPLSEHNDSGRTFAEIADAIEAQL